MKINLVSDIVKLLLFAAAIILVCIIVVLGFRTANEGKSTTGYATEQYNKVTSQYTGVDKSVYDGIPIMGSELVDLIKSTIDKEEYLSIVVKTLESARTDYNYVYDAENSSLTEGGTKEIQDNKSQGSYINRGALFKGSVKKDANGNIICIWFEQQK